MKKIIALFLAVLLTVTFVACGKDNSGNDVTEQNGIADSETTEAKKGSVNITKDDIIGEWYDVATSQRVIFNSDLSLVHFKSKASYQPGFWSIENNTVKLNSATIRNDLTAEAYGDSLSLKNETFTFVKWECLNINKIKIGKKVEMDDVSFTLTDVEFVADLPAEITESSAFWSNGNLKNRVESDETVYAKITFDVTNLSKTAIGIPTLNHNISMDIIVDYNNGFRYSTHNNDADHFFKANEDVFVLNVGGSTTGYDITIQPLQSETIEAYIECPTIISTDKSADLKIDLITRFGTQANYYSCSVR